MASTTSAVSVAKAAPAPMRQPPNRWTSDTAKLLQRVGATILVVIFFAASVVSTHERHVESLEVWGEFHYYLGAKYFSELGYFNLYPCALEADQEAGGYWGQIAGARDMDSYRLIPRENLPPCPRANFTAARWSEFSRDVEHFAITAPPIFFAQVFSDKGLNPPPSWVSIARPLAQAIPISKNWAADIVFNLDVAAVLIGVLLIWRSRGGIAALLTAGLSVFYFGNCGLIAGNFLQYFWFPFLILAIILWATNRPGLSGAMLGVAVGLQVFPLFFGLPIVIRGIIDFVRRRKKEEWQPHFKFSGALIAVMLASFLLGSLAGQGSGAWDEWQRKISNQKDYIQGEIFNIGLANSTAATLSTNHRDVDYYEEDIPNTFMRLDALKSNIWIYYALCAIFLAVWVFVVAYVPAGDLFGQGFLILYTLASLSPYYYLTLALVPWMFWKSSRILRLYATGGTIALFAAHAMIFRGQLYASFRYLPHLLSGCSIALFLFGLAVISVLSNRLAARGIPQRKASYFVGRIMRNDEPVHET